eukprot:TRINITY_DN26450_c0_g1_i2.p1 TRINITY_DN26450_c0_g1~~TRINITY_DN26450_c0_g1_i2.p1  ORF type:complete len:323 (-),score=54.84 TRINITY_DN26450_c0_g1_i2:77-1045(-)
MLNLILSVIVEAAVATAALDEAESAEDLKRDQARAADQLIEFCQIIDADGSGKLSRDEFFEGFETFPEFELCLRVMGAHQEDLHMLYSICDEDGSGDVDYREMAQQLRRMQHQGTQLTLFYVSKVAHMIRDQLAHFGVRSQAASMTAARNSVMGMDDEMDIKEPKLVLDEGVGGKPHEADLPTKAERPVEDTGLAPTAVAIGPSGGFFGKPSDVASGYDLEYTPAMQQLLKRLEDCVTIARSAREVTEKPGRSPDPLLPCLRRQMPEDLNGRTVATHDCHVSDGLAWENGTNFKGAVSNMPFPAKLPDSSREDVPQPPSLRC